MPIKENKDSKKAVQDIFNESALRILNNSSVLKSEVEEYPESTEPVMKKDVITDDNISVSLQNSTKAKQDAWENLRDLMEGEFTTEFTKHVKALPPREYIRVYLKLVEFFKPKITREIGVRPDAVDKDIHIHVHDEYESKMKIS